MPIFRRGADLSTQTFLLVDHEAKIDAGGGRRIPVSADKGSNAFSFSSTPPFTRDFFLQGQGQSASLPHQPSPVTSVHFGSFISPVVLTSLPPIFLLVQPFLDGKSSDHGLPSTSRSLEDSGSYTEAIFPTLLPPSEDVGDIPDLYTNLSAAQPAFAVALQGK